MKSALTPSQAKRLERTRRNRETAESGLIGEARRQRTDLGLALLSLAIVPGAILTRDDIAAWCGCTQEAIRRIEFNALRKIQKRRSHLLIGLHPGKAA